MFFRKPEEEYFCARDWTGQISLISFEKIACPRTDYLARACAHQRVHVGRWRQSGNLLVVLSLPVMTPQRTWKSSRDSLDNPSAFAANR
jgi:hypothetical protein